MFFFSRDLKSIPIQVPDWKGFFCLKVAERNQCYMAEAQKCGQTSEDSGRDTRKSSVSLLHLSSQPPTKLFSLLLPEEIHPAHLSSGVAQLCIKSDSLCPSPILNSQGRISDWPNLGQMSSFLRGMGANMAVRTHPVLSS